MYVKTAKTMIHISDEEKVISGRFTDDHCWGVASINTMSWKWIVISVAFNWRSVPIIGLPWNEKWKSAMKWRDSILRALVIEWWLRSTQKIQDGNNQCQCHFKDDKEKSHVCAIIKRISTQSEMQWVELINWADEAVRQPKKGNWNMNEPGTAKLRTDTRTAVEASHFQAEINTNMGRADPQPL